MRSDAEWKSVALIAGSAHDGTVPARHEGSYLVPMILMVTLYFSIGFITALNDILVPHFKDLFHLTNVLALLVQFCFFGAYFIMSLPSGWIVGRIGSKAGILAALLTMTAGLLGFIPASIVISYPLFLFALFVVGSGLALLQVAINPYVGALGKPETASSRLNICGFFNSLATTVAPRVGAALIFIAAGATTAQLARSVRAPYLGLAAFAFLLAVVTSVVKLPRLLESSVAASEAEASGSAWRFRHLRLAAAGIFAYVGAEVAIGSIMIAFLAQPAMGSLSHASGSVVRFGVLVQRDDGTADRVVCAGGGESGACACGGFGAGGRSGCGDHPWTRTSGDLGDRAVWAGELDHVAVPVSAGAEGTWAFDWAGIGHSGDDGGGRSGCA